jgi:hypothetical protein
MVNPPIADELVDHDQYQHYKSDKYQYPFKRSIHAGEPNGVVEISGSVKVESILLNSILLRINLDVLKLSEQCQTRQDLIGHIGVQFAFG